MRKVIRVFLALVFGLSSQILSANSYYISSTTGNDAWPGTRPDSAKQTLAAANAINLLPGDSLLFRRGDEFRGFLDPDPGSTGNPVTYSAFGSGSKPVFKGSLAVSNSGWTLYQGNIWMKQGLNINTQYLFVDGKLMTPARYPNSTYELADSIESTTVHFSFNLPAIFTNTSDLLNARITIRDPFSVATGMVTSYNPATGRVAHNTSTNVQLKLNRGYYLSNKLNLLDQPGEWFFDNGSGTVYVWFPPGASPTTSLIEYSNTDWAMWCASSETNIRITHLEFRHYRTGGIRFRDDMTIEDNCFRLCKFGVWGLGATSNPIENVVIRNNLIEDCITTGIDFARTDNSLVEGNTVRRSGLKTGLGQNIGAGFWNFGVGINTSGNGNIIRFNEVDSCNFLGIAYGGSNNCLVKNNIVRWACLDYNDCGGIYVGGTGPDSNSHNNTIEANIVYNCFGSLAGMGHNDYRGRGIYLDFQWEGGTTVRHNTLIGNSYGIGLTEARGNLIRDNTCYDARVYQYRMNRKTNDQPLNNSIVNNTFFSIDYDQLCHYWDNQVSGNPDFNFLDSNSYWHPYRHYPIRYNNSGGYDNNYYLELWQSQTGRDVNSSKEFIFLNYPYHITDTTGPNLVANSTFDNLTWWSTWQLDAQTDNPAQFAGSNPAARLTLNTIAGGGNYTYWSTTFRDSNNVKVNLNSNQWYLVSFSIMSVSEVPIEIRFKEGGGDQTIHFSQEFPMFPYERKNYQLLFKPLANDKITFQFRKHIGQNPHYWVDDVYCFPVNVQYDDPHERFPVFVNETNVVLSVPLTGTYLDLDSQSISGSITLQPYSSQIMIKVDSATTSHGYCSAYGVDHDSAWIKQICVGTVCHTAPNDAGYSDYTHLSGRVIRGNAYNFTFSPPPGAPSAQWQAWLDINHDNDFDDAGEMLFNTVFQWNGPISSSFTVPANALTGPTTFRILMGDVVSGACAEIPNGDVHDYTLIISVPYCGQGGLNSATSWIDSWCVNSVCLNTGNNGGYHFVNSNYTLQAGNSFSLSLHPGGSAPVWWSLFFDTNRDGDFTDAGETLFATNQAFVGTVNGNFTIPGETLNSRTQLRLVMTEDTITHPCLAPANGEVEVVSLKITGGAGTRLSNRELELAGESGCISWTLFPNPTSQKVVMKPNVELKKNVVVSVLDLMGREVANHSFQVSKTNQVVLNVSHLPGGLHFVEIDGWVGKLVVE